MGADLRASTWSRIPRRVRVRVRVRGGREEGARGEGGDVRSIIMLPVQ